MTMGRVLRWSMLAGILAALVCMGALCEVTIVNPPADNTGETGGTGGTGGTGDPDGTGDLGDGDMGDGDTGDGGNPDSSCAHPTDIEVYYINESTARVVFVEYFRDSSNASIASSIHALKAAGDPDATVIKCITCPYLAGIRNIRYVEDGVTTYAPYPADLIRPAFACGNRITYTFGADGTVTASVQRH